MPNVTIICGPKPTLTYSDATPRRAEQRAISLAELHGCRAERIGSDWLIDASAYYYSHSAPKCRGCDNPPLPGYDVCAACGEEGY